MLQDVVEAGGAERPTGKRLVVWVGVSAEPVATAT
jgi:hypothetical protein